LRARAHEPENLPATAPPRPWFVLLLHNPTSGDYNPRVRMRDFEEVREAKLHASWRELDRNVDVIDVNNVCAMEINR